MVPRVDPIIHRLGDRKRERNAVEASTASTMAFGDPAEGH